MYNISIFENKNTNIIEVVQGDSGRVLEFLSVDYDIPSGTTGTYYVQKPSGSAVYNSCTISGNEITVPLTTQTLAEHGECPLQVRLEKDGQFLTSFDVVLIVRPFRGIDAAESTTEMNIFDQEIENAREEISTVLDTTLTQANMAAEAKAVGDAFSALNVKNGTGSYSIIEGKGYVASGFASHAEGNQTSATANGAHAEGNATMATGYYSHAQGQSTEAKAICSFAAGRYTEANHASQFVFGSYNVPDPSTADESSKGTYVEIVGCGTSSSNKQNARTLDWNGNETLKGKITVGSDPVNDMDVATKGYVDGLFWTAVDEDDDGNVVITIGGAE